jgi:hypothetical protein
MRAAEQLFQSPNLRNLIELKVSSCPIGKAADVLTDPAVMPGLVEGWLSYCDVPDNIAKELQRKRPVVHAD